MVERGSSRALLKITFDDMSRSPHIFKFVLGDSDFTDEYSNDLQYSVTNYRPHPLGITWASGKYSDFRVSANMWVDSIEDGSSVLTDPKDLVAAVQTLKRMFRAEVRQGAIPMSILPSNDGSATNWVNHTNISRCTISIGDWFTREFYPLSIRATYRGPYQIKTGYPMRCTVDMTFRPVFDGRGEPFRSQGFIS